MANNFEEKLKAALEERRNSLEREARVAGIRDEFANQFIGRVTETMEKEDSTRIKLTIESISFALTYGNSADADIVTIKYSVTYYRRSTRSDFEEIAEKNNLNYDLHLKGFDSTYRGQEFDFSTGWTVFELVYESTAYTMPELTGIEINPLVLEF